MKTLLKGGKVATSSSVFRADVLIENERISAIGRNLRVSGTPDVIDAGGKLILPGAIDVHTHFQLPFCGTVSKDDFENGTQAAALGGVTTIIDFAFQVKGKRVMDAVRARMKEADGHVCIDYSLHAGITDWNERTENELKEIVDFGIPTFKMFMVYKSEGWMSDDAALYGALSATKKLGGMVGVHAENVYLIDYFIERLKKSSKQSAYTHALSRPDFTESEAITRAILMAEASLGRLYIFHMSTGAGADAVKTAKERGVKVWAETCPQYLLLTDEKFKGRNGHLYATCPPLRSGSDVKRLWAGLTDGSVQVTATDTCTFDKKQKAMWKGDFTKIPYGMPGVETLFPLMMTNGYKKRRFNLPHLVSLVSTNPAKLFGLYPQKGDILIGSDADLVVVDPSQKRRISWKTLHTNCDFSPFEGMDAYGFPDYTFSRGRLVAANGKLTGDLKAGKFVRRRRVREDL
jgi:dihydropyrimidinase